MPRVKLFCSFILLFASQSALAVSYPLPPEGSRLVGNPLTITVPDNNTQPLEAFAAQYGQGLSNMLEANPDVDVFAEVRFDAGGAAAAYFAGYRA